MTTAISPKNVRAPVSKAMRDATFAAHGEYCHLCGEFVEYADRVADHIKTVRAGGSTILGNLAPCHRACNEFRGARPLTSQLRAACRRRRGVGQ